MTSNAQHQLTELIRRGRPGWPHQATWSAALAADGRIGPLALAVALLLAAAPDRRRTWPLFVLSSRNVGQRLAIPQDSVERIAGALASIGYLSGTGGVDSGGRREWRATLPDGAVTTAPENTTTDTDS